MTTKQNSVANENPVRPIPEDYASITPYIIVKGVAQFITFLTKAFAAEERFRVPNEDGTIGHAEVWIGNSVVMVFDTKADWPETPSFLTLYVEDCDKVHHSALQADAATVTPLSTNAWGDRGSRIRDPFGNIWWLQTHVELGYGSVGIGRKSCCIARPALNAGGHSRGHTAAHWRIFSDEALCRRRAGAAGLKEIN